MHHYEIDPKCVMCTSQNTDPIMQLTVCLTVKLRTPSRLSVVLPSIQGVIHAAFGSVGSDAGQMRPGLPTGLRNYISREGAQLCQKPQRLY